MVINKQQRNICQVTSTPNVSADHNAVVPEDRSPDVSIIEPAPFTTIEVSDISTPVQEMILQERCMSSIETLQIKGPSRSIDIQVSEKADDVKGVGQSHFCDVGVGERYEEAPTNLLEDSAGDSASGSNRSGNRAEYYHNKLLATMQILENKEETVRIQGESLVVAETRIASLTTRIAEMRREIDRKDRDLQNLRKIVENVNENKIPCVTTSLQDMDSQKNIVETLQNNLSVIEELYRECFYETVKQDDLIEMLRKSYLDVRLMEKEKSDEIGKLQNVIHTQKWSLQRCQDIALEVENLKLEISNFLNSSSYDSGMWERSEASVASELGEDLHDIMEHLLRLRDLLTSDCTCGLEEENLRLKRSNDLMQVQIGELNARISELEVTLLEKDDEDQKCKTDISMKENELQEIRKQLVNIEDSSRDQSIACDSLSFQLQHTEELLKDKTTELLQAQKQCGAKDMLIKELKKELEKTDMIIKENEKMRSEVSYLRNRVCVCSEQSEKNAKRVRALETELANARTHCATLHASYREKVQDVMELQSQLEEAQASGSALCSEARRALSAVRRWARQQRDRHAEQEEKIREKDKLIEVLQKRLRERERNIVGTSASETEASCSKCVSNRREHIDVGRCFTPKEEDIREQCVGTSGSEMASCSSAPVPPKRMSRRKLQIFDEHCSRRPSGASLTPRSPQRHSDCECSHSHVRYTRHSAMPRGLSPTAELLSYVERLGTTLADCRRRWTHKSHSPSRYT